MGWGLQFLGWVIGGILNPLFWTNLYTVEFWIQFFISTNIIAIVSFITSEVAIYKTTKKDEP